MLLIFTLSSYLSVSVSFLGIREKFKNKKLREKKNVLCLL